MLIRVKSLLRLFIILHYENALQSVATISLHKTAIWTKQLTRNEEIAAGSLHSRPDCRKTCQRDEEHEEDRKIMFPRLQRHKNLIPHNTNIQHGIFVLHYTQHFTRQTLLISKPQCPSSRSISSLSYITKLQWTSQPFSQLSCAFLYSKMTQMLCRLLYQSQTLVQLKLKLSKV